MQRCFSSLLFHIEMCLKQYNVLYIFVDTFNVQCLHLYLTKKSSNNNNSRNSNPFQIRMENIQPAKILQNHRPRVERQKWQSCQGYQSDQRYSSSKINKFSMQNPSSAVHRTGSYPFNPWKKQCSKMGTLLWISVNELPLVGEGGANMHLSGSPI